MLRKQEWTQPKDHTKEQIVSFKSSGSLSEINDRDVWPDTYVSYMF